MKIKKLLSFVLSTTLLFSLVGCTEEKETDDTKNASVTQSTNETKNEGTTKTSGGKIVLVWYPNESAKDYEPARNEFGKLIEKATGKKVEQKLTTDYAIAIEAIANGTADICFMGAQGYIEAKNKCDDVEPLFVNSGASGTLDDAIYYSFINTLKGNEDQYKDDNGEYSINNIMGQKMSFVSNSSTSGFKVPTANIISYFSENYDEWKDISTDDLIEGGNDMFFSQVLFGGSHQGSAINLLTGNADIAAFCNTEIAPYADCVEGKEARPGAIYQIKDDASAPFNAHTGKQFVIIKSTPVLNGPFAYNTKSLSADDAKAIQTLFTSDEVTNNDSIFVKKDSGKVGMFKKTDKEKIVLVEDSWYNPIRELSN